MKAMYPMPVYADSRLTKLADPNKDKIGWVRSIHGTVEVLVLDEKRGFYIPIQCADVINQENDHSESLNLAT